MNLLAVLLLRSYGCNGVFLAETNPLRRRSAAEASGCETFDPRDGNGPADNTMDLVLDAVGGKSTRNAALKAVRPGGVVGERVRAAGNRSGGTEGGRKPDGIA